MEWNDRPFDRSDGPDQRNETKMRKIVIRATSTNKNGRSIRSVAEQPSADTHTHTCTANSLRHYSLHSALLNGDGSGGRHPSSPNGKSSSKGWFYGNCVRFRCSISSVCMLISVFLFGEFLFRVSTFSSFLRLQPSWVGGEAKTL